MEIANRANGTSLRFHITDVDFLGLVLAFPAMQDDIAIDDFARTVNNLQQSAGGDAFATPTFTHHAKGFAAVNIERHAIYCADSTFVGEKVDF